MSEDIIVGSVAVDIVPSTRRLRPEIQAAVKGISADIGIKADTTGVRSQIESATKVQPAKISVKVDDVVAKTQLAKLQNELKDKQLALDLSTTEAKAKIAALQAQIATVKSNVDLDPAEAQRQIVALQTEVKTLRGKLEIDTAPARSSIGQLRAEIAAQKITLKAQADTVEAEAQIDTAARDRTTTIRAKVDSSQVSAVEKIQGSLSGISGFATTLIALGPALIPILAVVGGLGLALAAPLAIAGGGATLFGFLAGFAVKDTNAQLKAIDKQREKLAGLTKGTKEYGAAQDDLRVLIGGLSPAQKKFSDALDHIKGSFAELLGGKVGNQLLAPVTAFLNIAADTLPKLAPIIGAVSDALSTLLGDLGKAVKGPEFQAFISAFADQVGPDIVAFGHIAGSVFKGVAGLVVSLGDAFGPGLLKGIENLTDNFADFGQQAGHAQKIQDFIGYVQRVGPQVGDTIGAVARGIGHVVQALAPLGPPALKAVEGIANAISGIPIPVLTALAAAFAAITVASKVTKGLGSVTGLLGGVGGGLGTRGNTPATPLYVWTVNGGAGGVGGKTGGTLGKLGTLALGATAVGLLDDQGSKLLTKEFGSVFGDTAGRAAAASFRAVFALPDPALKDAGPKIAQGFFSYLFKKSSASQAALDTLTPQAVQQQIDLRRADIPEIRSTTDGVDALHASLAKASRTIDLIGPHADIAFGTAKRDVADFSAKLDAVKDKKLRVILDDLAAVQSLKALQALRLKDKTLTIRVEQEMERVVGPGGGQGRPTGGSSGGAGFSPSAAPGGRGRGDTTIHVDKLQPHNYNEFRRELQNHAIARGGGGVDILGAPA